jgi:hypothetical protein
MRTKWFTIDANDGLLWKNASFGDSILGRVGKNLMDKGVISDDEYSFARFIGIRFSDQ